MAAKRETPQARELREAIISNNISKIKNIISQDQLLLKYEYSEGKVLQIATYDANTETFETLIDLGANPTEVNKYTQYQVIHAISEMCDVEKLKILVKKLEPAQINALALGDNALLVILTSNNPTKKNFLECVKILIENGLDVNQSNCKDYSPILIASAICANEVDKRIISAYKEFIKLLLEDPNWKGKLDIDTHQHIETNKTARDYIVEKKLYEGTLPEICKDKKRYYEAKTILFSYIKRKDAESVKSFNNGKIEDVVNEVDDDDGGEYTLLQLACKMGSSEIVEYLLEKGADHSKITRKTTTLPIEIAAERGFYDIFNKLIHSPNITVPESLSKLIREKIIHQKKFSTHNNAQYDKYFSIHIKMLKHRESKDFDIDNQSIFLKCLQNREFKKAEQLLSLDASLAVKNEFKEMPIDYINSELLERHLDSCIEIKEEKKHGVQITFKYKTLIPPENFKDRDPKTSKEKKLTAQVLSETDAMYKIRKSKELKHLLLHPVIVSFLTVKWHKLRWISITNFVLFLIFYASILTYIYFSYINFESHDHLKTLSEISHCFLIFTFCFTVLREILQMIIDIKYYIKDFDNIVELILLSITLCILVTPNASDETRKMFSALAVLVSTVEVFLMITIKPEYSTYVIMLKQVSKNFFKFLKWYLVLIVAFTLSFNILFSAKNKDLFQNPVSSAFKTIVMLTGELDSDSLKFEEFPILGKIVFVLFILMIPLILMNLLNGLAVSDTHQILNKSELIAHIATLHRIRNIEKILDKYSSIFFIKRFIKKYSIFIDEELTFTDGKYNNVRLDNETRNKVYAIIGNRKKEEPLENIKCDMDEMKNDMDKMKKNNEKIKCDIEEMKKMLQSMKN